MAISVNWSTKIISIPQADLTPLGGGIYQLDANALRLAIKDLEDDEVGIVFPDATDHNTAVTLAGVTYARTINFINGYTVLFENGAYTVKCVGANHNIGDVKVVNSVSLLIGNSAGLVQVSTGSGLSDAQNQALTDILADTSDMQPKIVDVQADVTSILNYAIAMSKWKNNKLAKTVAGTVETWVLYDDDSTTPLLTWTRNTSTNARTKAT